MTEISENSKQIQLVVLNSCIPELLMEKIRNIGIIFHSISYCLSFIKVIEAGALSFFYRVVSPNWPHG